MKKAFLNIWEVFFHALAVYPASLFIESFIHDNVAASLIVVLLGIFAGVGIFKFGAPVSEVFLLTYFLVTLMGAKDWALLQIKR